MADQLHTIFDRRIKQLLGEVKAVCYDRSRPDKSLVTGARSFSECLDNNLQKLQRFEAMGRLHIIYTEMLMERARTDEQLRQAVLQQEFTRETIVENEPFRAQ